VGYKWNGFSIVDSPNSSAAIVYHCGCNLTCKYCYNPELRHPSDNDLSLNDILINIHNLVQYTEIENKSKSLGDPISWTRVWTPVDWLILSGGEPLLDKPVNIKSILEKAKQCMLKTGIFTSGSRPDMIWWLISTGLVNYWHVDFKYYETQDTENFEIDANALESIRLIYDSMRADNTSYLHINTTLMKSIHTEDILQYMKSRILNQMKCDNEIYITNKIEDVKLSWILTPISNDLTNTLTPIDYAKDGFTAKELEQLYSSIN